MYPFLSTYKNTVLDQIDITTGQLELDLSNDEHYQFLLEEFGGLQAIYDAFPNHEETIDQLRNTPLKQSISFSSKGYREGPEDRTAIETLIFQDKISAQGDLITENGLDRFTMARVIADFLEVKNTIAVTTKVYDATNEKLILSDAKFNENSSKFTSVIKADYSSLIEKQQRQFLMTSTFITSTISVQGNQLLNAYVTKQVGFTIDGEGDIVKSFTLNAPVIHEKHRNDPNHTKVKIAYQRKGSIPDYDYSNEENPFHEGNQRKILVRVPFSTTIEANDGWWINGVFPDYGYKLWLKNMVNGTINHYCNFEDIKQVQLETYIDEKGKERCKKMMIEFPETWNNILDFSKIENQIFTNVDIYGSFFVDMRKYGEKDSEISALVNVSVSSDGEEYLPLNLSCAQIYIQWGCIARDTEILMADGTSKRADEVINGDIVRDSAGNEAKILQVITGREIKLLEINTTNRKIRLTEDHTVGTEHGLLPANKIQPGMNIRTVSGLEAVTAVQWCEYNDEVYNFEFEHETIIVGNGVHIGDLLLQNRVRELESYEN